MERNTGTTVQGNVRDNNNSNNRWFSVLFRNKLFYLTKEMLRFLWKKKLWWLTPIIVMLVLVGLLLVFGQNSILSPFVYALF